MAETKVKSGKVRASFAHVFQPKAIEEGGEEKYSITALIPKKTKEGKAMIKAIEAAIEAAKEKGKSEKFSGKIPKNLKITLRDCDEEVESGDRDFRPEEEGMMALGMSSKKKPQVVDKDMNLLFSEDDFYSGCYFRFTANFYAYNVNGSKGIACGLNNIQKVADGERLSGGASADQDFDDDFDDFEDGEEEEEKPKGGKKNRFLD